MHLPAHAESQHTPSTQNPLEQPLSPWPGAPLAALSKHPPLTHTLVPMQSLSPLHGTHCPAQLALAHSPSPAQLALSGLWHTPPGPHALFWPGQEAASTVLVGRNKHTPGAAS